MTTQEARRIIAKAEVEYNKAIEEAYGQYNATGRTEFGFYAWTRAASEAAAVYRNTTNEAHDVLLEAAS